MDGMRGWDGVDPAAVAGLAEVWIPVGVPGYAGDAKARWRAVLDDRFGADGWRLAHVVRGRVVSRSEAIVEYEAAYDHFLRDAAGPGRVPHRGLRQRLRRQRRATSTTTTTTSPHTAMNHYQDISVRRVIAGLVDDPAGPTVTARPIRARPISSISGPADPPAAAGSRVPRRRLLQIRDPLSPGYCLNPAVVPVHDPALITSPAEPDGLVSRRGLRPPVGRGVLADEQGRRGPVRPVPRAGTRSRRPTRRTLIRRCPHPTRSCSGR